MPLRRSLNGYIETAARRKFSTIGIDVLVPEFNHVHDVITRLQYVWRREVLAVGFAAKPLKLPVYFDILHVTVQVKINIRITLIDRTVRVIGR